MDYKEIVDDYKDDLAKVETEILANFQTDVTLIPTVSAYLATGGGKRIRPLLAIVSARLCGYTGSTRHITHSVVVEYIHTATLLHDDVVDEADIRRGADAANIKFGNQASVLVGDFLFAKSFEMMSDDNDIRIIKAVSQATKCLAEGEVLQLVNTMNTEITEKVYLDTIYRKTGALIEACCKIGAILGGAVKEKEEALAEFGKGIGYAFQLVDDVLDYVGEAKAWGKPLGADLAEGKITLPLILALKEANKKEKETIYAILDSGDISEENLSGVIEILNKYNAIANTMDLAREYLDTAKLGLSGFEPSNHLNALISTADYIVERNI